MIGGIPDQFLLGRVHAIRNQDARDFCRLAVGLVLALVGAGAVAFETIGMPMGVGGKAAKGGSAAVQGLFGRS